MVHHLEEGVAWLSDFTTAAVFSAAALPPGALRVSQPELGGEIVGPPASEDDPRIEGEVFICGGAQLALPGTVVDVFNACGLPKFKMLSSQAAASESATICHRQRR